MCALIRDCWVLKSTVGSLSVCIGRAQQLMASEYVIFFFWDCSFIQHALHICEQQILKRCLVPCFLPFVQSEQLQWLPVWFPGWQNPWGEKKSSFLYELTTTEEEVASLKSVPIHLKTVCVSEVWLVFTCTHL